MNSERQGKIIGLLPRVKGHVRKEFLDWERKLSWYSYDDHDLDIIEKEVTAFVAAEEAKRIEKQRGREKLKADRLEAEKKKRVGGN